MKFLFSVFFFIVFVSFLSSTIINVPADQPTIQEGINVAVDGDTVLVQPDTYFENINYNGKNITVASLFLTTQDTIYISQTIIDGDSIDSVVTFESGEDSTSTLTGFTITNGSNFHGGGIYCHDNSNPILDNVKITENSANYGGGVSCVNSSPGLENVTITGNFAESGGGISCGYYSSPILEDVTILSNTASVGGGIGCWDYSNPTLVNVTITGNSAINKGGGISCVYHSNIIFDSENLSNIFLNFAGFGNDLYAFNWSNINVIVDTFTVLQPEDNVAYPIDNFIFDIQNAKIEQVNQDLYVSPFGSDANSGLSPTMPLQTIDYALVMIISDSTNSNTIYLANGTYSPSQTGEHFPINCKNYISIVGEDESLTILDGENTRGILFLLNDSNLSLTNLTITNGDYSDMEDGGITCHNSNPIVENVTVTGNIGIWGGGISCYDSNPILVNVAIISNSAYDGGGIYCSNSSPILMNVTLEGNSASWSGGGICCENNSSPNLINSILWNDSTEEIEFKDFHLPNTITIAYSVIEGGEAGIVTNNNGVVYWLEGNIDSDPLFINPDDGDFHLQETSPCIGAGIDEIEINGIWYYAPDFDIEGNPRPNPSGSMPDMGAYENPYGEPQVVLNGSFEIDGEPALDHWTISWNLGESYEDAAPGGGNWCLKLEAGNYQGYFPVYAYQVIPEIQNGEIWEAKVWVRQHYNITSASLYWRIFKADGSQIDLSASETYSETWTQLSVTDTILFEAGDSVAVILDSGVTGGPSVNWSYFDLVEAEMIWGVGISQYEISQINQTKCTNYPNPFNPETKIVFILPEEGNVKLEIYNIKGQKVKTLVNELLLAGEHSAIWDGRDSNGNRVSSGIYLYQLQTGSEEQVRKMLLLK